MATLSMFVVSGLLYGLAEILRRNPIGLEATKLPDDKVLPAIMFGIALAVGALGVATLTGL